MTSSTAGNLVPQEPLAVVRAINRAWTEHDFSALDSLLHPDMVIVGPDLSQLARGRAACAESYATFARQAVVHSFLEDDHRVQLVEQTAIVSYHFRIEYHLGGQRRTDAGRDALVLVRTDEGWQAAWRLPLFDPGEPDGG